MSNQVWLPEGNHYGLNIRHQPRPDAGPFVPSTPKLCWHTTEGTSLSGALSTLIGNHDEPHFVVSVDALQVVQLIALDRASKSLMHPPNTPETNRAHCVQVEICGRAADSQNWQRAKYHHLAALALMIEHRVKIERRTHVSWENPSRIPANQFAGWRGHIGHMHVPNNDHVDPGHFRIAMLFDEMHKIETGH